MHFFSSTWIWKGVTFWMPDIIASIYMWFFCWHLLSSLGQTLHARCFLFWNVDRCYGAHLRYFIHLTWLQMIWMGYSMSNHGPNVLGCDKSWLESWGLRSSGASGFVWLLQIAVLVQMYLCMTEKWIIQKSKIFTWINPLQRIHDSVHVAWHITVLYIFDTFSLSQNPIETVRAKYSLYRKGFVHQESQAPLAFPSE